MKNKNNKQEKAPANQKALDIIEEANPDLEYEAIQDHDQALRDFLDLCAEVYWQRVKDGTFPWPVEDDELDGLNESRYE